MITIFKFNTVIFSFENIFGSRIILMNNFDFYSNSEVSNDQKWSKFLYIIKFNICYNGILVIVKWGKTFMFELIFHHVARKQLMLTLPLIIF